MYINFKYIFLNKIKNPILKTKGMNINNNKHIIKSYS